MNLSPKYFAKILLFGEYGVIRDAMALSIPFTNYSGVLRFSEGEASFAQRESNASLDRFAAYLAELAALGTLTADLDLVALRSDQIEVCRERAKGRQTSIWSRCAAILSADFTLIPAFPKATAWALRAPWSQPCTPATRAIQCRSKRRTILKS